MEKFLKKRLFIVALCMMMGSVVFGQQVKVSGTVTDATDGSALPGVIIQVKGTFTGAVSDVDGKYSISATAGDVLVFSFVGYLPQEITVGTQLVINVSMAQDVKALEEVVVIGYGTVRKSDATGSVKAVDLDHFNPGTVSSPQEMIIGKMAGVQVVTGGGAPGSSATIRIRGGASLTASNDPLIVIDGVPVDTDGPTGMRNPLSTINANDIETYTVLKDASATAIYGSRASNGVVIITTKKGSSSNKFVVNYSGNVSYSTPIKYVEAFSAAEFKDIINTKYAANTAARALIGDYNTDWQKEIFNPAVSHDHNLNFSGGVKQLPYRVSLGYTNQNGILLTDNLERVTAAINISPSFFQDHLKLDISAKVMNNNNVFAAQGAIGSALTMDPTQPVYDNSTDYAGGFFFWRNTDATPLFVATMNPVAQIKHRDDISTVNRLIGNVMAEYKVHFLPDLKLKMNLGIDKSKSDGSITIPLNSPVSYSAYFGDGKYEVYNQNKTNSLLDMYFDYSKTLGDRHRINLVGGYSWQHFQKDGKNLDTTGDGVRIVSSTHYDTENYLVSFFGRLNYVLDDKYLFTATLRDDGSSRFSKDNRWGLFPSAAFAWNISKESFFANKVVSNLKLRLGYGVTGQQNITDNDYPYQAVYKFNTTGAYYQMGNSYSQTIRPAGYDKNIKWEQTATYNIGLDYGFLDDRITGEIDAYYKYTTDLINKIPVAAGTNLTNQINTNVGNMENRGIEFSVNGKIIATSDTYWEVGFNATYNEGTIKKLVAVKDPAYKGVLTGGISGGVGNNIQIHSTGQTPRSFYVLQQVYDTEGAPIEGLYVDRNGDGSITSDDKYICHSPAPKVYMGFSSIFRYKDFDFNFNGRINLGNYVYNNVASNYGAYSGMANTAYLSNRVKSLEKTQFENPQYFSDYYMENGSFLKLDNISVGYSFKNLFNMMDVRASITAQNLITITKYSGLDPEVFDGIDNNLYPRPRIFMLGLSVTL
jgi:TonB-dependent starch-binding outer membrane protein SusC